MMPRLAVIVPTRGRVALLDRMFASLQATTWRPQQLEVLLKVDDDDAETLDYLRGRVVAWRQWIVVGPRLQGYRSLPLFVNQLARLSTANLLFVINDEAIFRTFGWDQVLWEAAKRYPDGVFDLGVSTVQADDQFCFPCTSRRILELLGGIHDERLLFNDLWLRDVLEFFGRAVRVSEITIEHDWCGNHPDRTWNERQVECVATMKASPSYAALHLACVMEAVDRLRIQLPPSMFAQMTANHLQHEVRA